MFYNFSYDYLPSVDLFVCLDPLPFFNWAVCFPIFSLKSSSYILGASAVSDMHLAIILSQFVACLFILLKVYFLE